MDHPSWHDHSGEFRGALRWWAWPIVVLGYQRRRVIGRPSHRRDRALLLIHLIGRTAHSLSGERGELPASGRRVSVPCGIGIFHLAGGKVDRGYLAWNKFALLQQVGAL